mgnify:CR=1 FL=1
MIATTTANAGLAGIMPMFLIMGAFLLVYMISMRPQRKQMKQLQAKREMMKKGDKVVTAGGFHGKVFSVKDDTVIIEMLPDNVKMRINKSSIIQVDLREVPERKGSSVDDSVDFDDEDDVAQKPVPGAEKINKNAKDYSKKRRTQQVMEDAKTPSAEELPVIDAEIVEEDEVK